VHLKIKIFEAYYLSQFMNTAYLLTGGNIGDRTHYLQLSAQLITQYCGQIITTSAIYETEAWGITNQPTFYNQVLIIKTLMQPEQLMQTILSIEEKMGRVRTIKMGPRAIDIDILLIDDRVMQTDLLTLPHPFLHERRFALTPLAEVAPQLKHPILQKTISELLLACTDKLHVNKIS
jgi:2-amino-4-hydroxy-6-hydroxymethyldihydropteridine diphosphokinase